MRNEVAYFPETPVRTFDDLPRIVEAVGRPDFWNKLVTLLFDMCRADHCTVFNLSSQSPHEIVAISRDGTDTAMRQSELYLANAYWRHDDHITDAISGKLEEPLSLTCFDTEMLENHEFRDRIYQTAGVRERILLCGRSESTIVGISILRNDHTPHVAEKYLHDLSAVSRTLVSVVSKHVEIVDSYNRFPLALTSLAEIEDTIRFSDVPLPKREAEVCARILYGISSAGIALDLAIGEETVATYRKRTYQRLGIATQRELLIWYLREWGSRNLGTCEHIRANAPRRELN